MIAQRTIRWSILLLAIGAGLARAEDKPPVIEWSAKDQRGNDLKVPVADKPTVLVFARVDQPQSKEAFESVKSTLEQLPAQVIVIFSGETAGVQAKALADGGKYAWPVVTDPEFAASGKMDVHVWPTVLVVQSNGNQVAHLAGMPPTFSADLTNYLAFASGKLDGPTLQRRLTTREVVTDGDDQKAARHMQVARRLFDSGDVKAARTEVEADLKLQADNAELQVMLARILVSQNAPKDALDLLSRVKPDALPAWQTALVKTWALIALDKWDDAKLMAKEAIRLNPQPAEACYAAGLIASHEKDFAGASDFFRKAYEASPDGRKLLSTQKP